MDLVLARADDDVAARGATGAKAFAFLEKPDPHLKTKILRRQRPDGTNINGVQRIIIIERLARKVGQGAVAAALHKTERVIARNVPRETDAARAKNTAFIIQDNARPQIHMLGLWTFSSAKRLAARP